MRSTIRSVLVTACIFLVAAALSAQATVSLGGAGTLTLKGFISATAFAQDQNTVFGNGQNAEFPAGAQCEVDCWFGGGDIRNTRLTLAFDGPKLFGDWKGGGTVDRSAVREWLLGLWSVEKTDDLREECLRLVEEALAG